MLRSVLFQLVLGKRLEAVFGIVQNIPYTVLRLVFVCQKLFNICISSQCKAKLLFSLFLQLFVLQGADLLQTLPGQSVCCTDITKRVHHFCAEGAGQLVPAFFGNDDQVASVGVHAAHRVGGQCRTGIYQVSLLHDIPGGQVQTACADQLCKLLQKGRMALFIVVKNQDPALQKSCVQVLQE